MNKNTFTAVQLAKGEVNVYDFETVMLHAYKTNDFIDNEVFIVEKAGKAVILESPCFFDNIEELTTYLNGDYRNAGCLSRCWCNIPAGYAEICYVECSGIL